MPPWHADPNYGEFSNDTRLSAQEIATLTAWVDQEQAEMATLKLPAAPVFQEKGRHAGKPDAGFAIPESA